MEPNTTKIAAEINALWAGIKVRKKKTLADQWEIGKRLEMVRRNCVGGFMKWVRKNLDLSFEQANKCRRLAQYSKTDDLEKIMQKINGKYIPVGSKMLHTPIPNELMRAIEIRARKREMSKHDFICEIIGKYLGVSLCKKEKQVA